jgi:hypothetical protein
MHGIPPATTGVGFSTNGVKLKQKDSKYLTGLLGCCLVSMTACASDEITPELGFPDADLTDAVHILCKTPC